MKGRDRVVVVGSGTNAGKTFVACRLIEDLVVQGRTVAVCKPVVSGFVDDDQSDPARLMAAASSASLSLQQVSPWRFADAVAPDEAARRAGVTIQFDDVVAACAAGPAEITLIETAGGVMSPLTEQHTQVDLVVALAAPTVLVVDASYLGSISHGLSAWQVLKARGVVVAAVVCNRGPSEPFARFAGDTLVLDVDERERLAARITALLPSSLFQQPGRVS